MQTEEAKGIYRQRGEMAEFANAWIKAKLGLRQFHVRTLAKVKLEVLWACLTYNIQQWIGARWRASWSMPWTSMAKLARPDPMARPAKSAGGSWPPLRACAI
jgi:hypothetical protein